MKKIIMFVIHVRPKVIQKVSRRVEPRLKDVATAFYSGHVQKIG